MNATIEAHIPEQLLRQAENLIKDGWASDLDALIVEALRGFVESHQVQVAEAFIREDVEWGLRGDK